MYVGERMMALLGVLVQLFLVAAIMTFGSDNKKGGRHGSH